MSTTVDSKKRFSDRVEEYVKYRPHYPKMIIKFLEQEKLIDKSTIVADIGSGTGLLTKIFLDNGNKVFGVEPNPDMRLAGENFLKNYPNFVSITGSSEKTTLPNHIVDVITAGQAYHWFDIEKTAKEFTRILKKSDKDNIFLIWNNRNESSEFNKSYEKFIQKYSNKANRVNQLLDDKIKAGLFFDKKFKNETFSNKQELSLEDLKGRMLSSSYMIKKTDDNFSIFEQDLKNFFQNYEENEKVTLTYDTELYYGNLD